MLNNLAKLIYIFTFAPKKVFMSKIKYRFNPESLKFDKVRTSVRRTIVKAFTLVTATVPVALLYYLILSPFFPTPKERILSREINQMTANYETLTKSLQQIEDVLADIQQQKQYGQHGK